MFLKLNLAIEQGRRKTYFSFEQMGPGGPISLLHSSELPQVNIDMGEGGGPYH